MEQSPLQKAIQSLNEYCNKETAGYIRIEDTVKIMEKLELDMIQHFENYIKKEINY